MYYQPLFSCLPKLLQGLSEVAPFINYILCKVLCFRQNVLEFNITSLIDHHLILNTNDNNLAGFGFRLLLNCNYPYFLTPFLFHNKLNFSPVAKHPAHASVLIFIFSCQEVYFSLCTCIINSLKLQTLKQNYQMQKAVINCVYLHSLI